MRFAEIYGSGAVMGFTPQQIDEMSIWEFNAAIDGYVDAHSTEDNNGMTKEEYDEIAADILALS